MNVSRAVTAVALVATLAVVPLGPTDSSAQDKRKYSFKTPPGVSKYTQQHVIDVADVPGHQIRIYEIHTKYTSEAPSFDGVKVVEAWARGSSDYTNGSGGAKNYGILLLENGDKIFLRTEILTQAVVTPDGSRKSKFSTVAALTGGTGKFQGIRGTLNGSGATDFKTGTSDVVTEGEYWFEQ
jgi:hypothetical protein